MNHQTPGPIFNRQAPPQFPHSRNLETKMGDRVALVDPKPFWDAGLDGETRHDTNARLLAASFNAFDKAGRELGIDAAELAEKLDLAALITAALAVNNARLLSSRDVRVISAQARLSAALATLRSSA